MAFLYGDGIHDDQPAIQELLDSGCCEVALGAPKAHYLLGRTLKIHSFQTLRLPRYAVIRMADDANCPMLENADPLNGNRDFSLIGGIWDYNNRGQAENPIQVPHPEMPEYTGVMFYFYNVKHLRVADLTFKDPVNFCLTLDRASYFTVENLTFDFNHGNPTAVNMDGVHLDGNCHYGLIRNLKGACYDDLVALNADEGSDGPISHIEVDGIFCEDCHSAARLLSVKNAVEDIHIHNVHGTFYQYCIGVTKYYPGKTAGYFDGLVFENIHASKAMRYSFYQKDGTFEFPLIWFEKELLIKNAVIREVYRRETVSQVPLICMEQDTTVENLCLSNIVQESDGTLRPILMENQGHIQALRARGLRSSCGETISGGGTIGSALE